MSCPFAHAVKGSPKMGSPASSHVFDKSQVSLDDATLMESTKLMEHRQSPRGSATPTKPKTANGSVHSRSDSNSSNGHPVIVNNIQPVQLYENEKTKQLAEFVERMKSNHTSNNEQGFKHDQLQKIKTVVAELLKDSERVEEHVRLAQNELFHKAEEAFFDEEDELEITQTLNRQAEELKAMKSLHESLLKDRISRKTAKRLQRDLQREVKMLHQKIHNQDQAQKTANEVKKTLRAHHERIERLIKHTEERHHKQTKQIQAAQERKILDQRILMELQCRHLNEEQKSDAMKEFQSKVGHQKTVDKKVNDQLRDRQLMELRHLKERVDLETKMMEDLSNLRAHHLLSIQEKERFEREEYQSEKGRIENTKESIKSMEIQMQNNFEIKRILVTHKNQIRQLKRAQKARKHNRRRYWANILNRDLSSAMNSQNHSISHSMAGSQIHSVSHSNALTRQGSNESIHHGAPSNNGTGNGNLNLIDNQEDEKVDYDSHTQHLEAQKKQANEQLQKMYSHLEQLARKHRDSMMELKKSQREELSKREEEFQKEMVELQWRHDVETKDFQKDNEAEIAEILAVQEHELEMDNQIRGAETRALQERKVLNTLLDTIIDGVVSIDPIGTILRFNASAEKIFGYPSAEIIGKNVKTLMPAHFAVNHDEYLFNYLSTGVRKVIGSGRQVTGKRKNGTEFPIHLSISEVNENGFHIFTAIVRDLTEEAAKEKLRKAEEECVTQLMWRVNKKGDLLYANSRLKDYCGMDDKTIKFRDVNVLSKPFVHPDDVVLSKKAFLEALKNKTSFEIKRRIRDSHGVYRWHKSIGAPIFNDQGDVEALFGTCTNIEESVQKEDELALLPESIPLMVWKADKDGNVVYCNNKFKTFTGLGLGANVFSDQVVHPDDVARCQEYFAEANKYLKSFECERRLKSAQNQYQWFLTRAAPILTSEGTIAAWYGTCTDIEETKRLSSEFEILPECIPQLVWKADIAGNVLYVNSNFKKYTGYTGEKAMNVFSEEFVHPDDIKTSLLEFRRASDQKRLFEVKRRILGHDGKYQYFMTRGAPILDSKGNITAWYGTCTELDEKVI